MLYHALSNVARECVPDVSVAAQVGVEAALTLIVAAWRWMRAPRPSQSEDNAPTAGG